MARKVFYSFHFKRDSWRAGQVRNSRVVANEDEYGVIDAVAWEKVEREGDDAIKRWINEQLKNTSVTAVLIGAETAERDWIDYEIRQSWQRGNGLVGIRIHGLKNQDQKTDTFGRNPLDSVLLANGKTLSSICRTYDWVADSGITNLGNWVEEAFQTRANYKGETALKDAATIQPTQQPSYIRPAPTVIKNPSGLHTWS